MMTFIQNTWITRKNSQLLIGLYCIISVYCLMPISANSVHDSPAPVTHSKATNQGKVNYGYLEEVPKSASTATGQDVTESSQNDGTRQTNVKLPKIPISIRSITKRSIQEPRFPYEIHYSNNNGLMQSVKSCKDNKKFCNTHIFNKDGFQQMTDFKLLQRNKQDYSDNNDKETYIPGLTDINVEFPYNNRIDSSNIYNYDAPPSQDPNTISDVYSQSRVTYNKVVLPFNKPIISDPTLYPHFVNHNMQQDPLTMLHDNAIDELAPIQEVKKNIFVSHGWGATGMPFNVLYIKPASRSAVVRAEQIVTPAPLTGFPIASKHQQVATKNVLNNAPKTGNRRGRNTRRQYPVLPQLFSFYGRRLGK